jgi:hypothetical protein
MLESVLKYKYFILVALVIIVIGFTYRYFSNKTDPNKPEKIKKVSGVRMKGIGLASKLGFPTINLKLNKEIPCGFYAAKMNFANVVINATLIVGKNDLQRADCHFVQYHPNLDTLKKYDFHTLVKVINKESDIISTFNAGCC